MKAYRDDTNTRVALLEQCVGHINDTLKEIRDDIKGIKSDVKSEREELRKEIKSLREHIDDRFDKLTNRIWNLFFWMIGGGGSILYVIAKTNHWLT